MTPHESKITLCICGDRDCKIPYGYCHCGCGNMVSVSPRNVYGKGLIKGEPVKYVNMHHSNPPRPKTIQDQGFSWREIPLTLGQVSKVSAHRYEELSQYSWRAVWKHGSRGYYAARTERCDDGSPITIYMHRQILGLGTGDLRQGDHVNSRDTLDNRDENLRICDFSQQNYNHRRRKDNSSGYKGVMFHKQIKRWRARIRVNGVPLSLGCYDTRDQAYAAYCAAAEKYHGEFARFA